jgi:tetratricopeptide (TPR) repeat protein
VPNRSLARALVVVVSAAGAAAGVVTFRNERRVEDAFAIVVEPRPDTKRAIDLFESSRALNPGAARELAEAGLYARAGRLDQAERALRDAGDLEPDNVQVWYGLTRLALARGRDAEARRHWARARSLDSQLPAALPAPLPGPVSRG